MPKRPETLSVTDPPEPEAAPEPLEAVLRRPSREERAKAIPEVEVQVVYLGSNPHYAIYMEGTTERVDDASGPSRWTPSAAGAETYTFDRHDTRGQVIGARQTRDGKMFVVCRNIYHLARFYQATDADQQPLFEIRGDPGVIALIQRVLERQQQAAKADFYESQQTLDSMKALLDARLGPARV